MIKNKGLIISTIIFFLIVNTNYFWEAKLGILAFPAFIILVIAFFILTLLFLRQLFLLIKEKFTDKKRYLTIGVMVAVLTLTFLKPNGIVDFDKLQGKDFLVAQAEGAANCMTIIKLKENNIFRERSVCFGVSVVKGNYEIINDTIFFTNIEYGRHDKDYYKFAVIKPSRAINNKKKFDLVLYRNYHDTIGYKLWIVKKNF